MSTRCRIGIIIPEKKKGISIYLGKELVDYINPLEDYTYTIPVDSKIMSIYVHHDGYPEGVGQELMKYNYDLLFNSMLLGDRSSLDILDVGFKYCYYTNGEDPYNIIPIFHKSLNEYKNFTFNTWSEYCYLMNKRGQIRCYDLNGKLYKIN